MESRGSSGPSQGPNPGSISTPGLRGEKPAEGQHLAPVIGPLDRTQIETPMPDLSQERRCPLHRYPVTTPLISSGPLPVSSTFQPQGQKLSSPPGPPRFPYPRVQQEYRGGYTLPGPGDRTTLCSHHSSLSPSPVPSQRDGSWKPRPVQHHVVSVRHEQAFRIPRSYSQMIAEWPQAVLLMCFATILLCTVAGLLGGELPDFSEPLLGFEPRDTEVGRKLAVWKIVQELTGNRKVFSLTPDPDLNSSDGSITMSPMDWGSAQEGLARPRRMVEPWEDRGKEGFFCGPPEKSYSQLVFMSTTTGSLWNLQAIQSMCRIEQEKIRSHAHFRDLCQRTSNNECCPSWSIGNYIAVLYNRSSCLDVTQGDSVRTLALLRACAPYYHRGALVPACLGTQREKNPHCTHVPEKCVRVSAIYQLLHFLVDRDFLSPQTADYQVPSLKYSLLFLPAKKGASMMNIYLDNLASSWELFDNYTSITGMDLGLKQQLFQHYLVRDMVYPVLALVAMFLSVSLYLRSLFITFMMLLMVIGSLLVSFFVYRVAFRLAYFPFVNLTAILLLSSICINYTLVFFDLWSLSKGQFPSMGLSQRVSHTMHHFGYLLLVSSLTTGTAFYASYLSHLSAIRCFAIYMGTAVLVNLAFMLTWLPSSMVLYERYLAPACVDGPWGYWGGSGHQRFILALQQQLRTLQQALRGISHLLFQRLLPCSVIKFRYIWICWFAALAAGGAYIAGFSPRLRLPILTMPRGQVFRPSHPFERFDAEYRQQFMFERLPQGEGGHMPVSMVWGILPIDTGDPLDPRSNGTLVSDPTFSARGPQAQRWLLTLCHQARNQSFYYVEQEGEPTLCFVEELQRWMTSHRCAYHGPGFCCGHFHFPFGPQLFLHCLKMMALEQSPDGSKDLGPRFDAEGNLVALVLQFQTNFHYSVDYSQTHRFYLEVSRWLKGELRTAPWGLRNGWFTSHLDLYSLQHSLSTEPVVILGLAIALSFAILLLGTWNVLLSLFSVMAIAGTVMLTLGLLVLLEWQLNAAESLFLSAAVGLSVDFTVNYCISYHLCPHPDRLSRVAFSLRQMSCATAMGASALFSAGVFMLPATVLLYRKLAIFLMMVKCISCGFASFFFHSLCCFFGPEKNCGQILWPCVRLPRDYGGCEPGREKASRHCPGPVGVTSATFVEQYELQPLARRRSNSFDTSTTTSKLSHRPSVLSEELQLQENHCFPRAPPPPILQETLRPEPQEPLLDHQVVFGQCPALQTSSPYKESSSIPKVWAGKDSQSLEAGTPRATTQPVMPTHASKAKVEETPHCLCSSASSLEGLSVSDETCLSTSEPSVPVSIPDSVISSPEVQDVVRSLAPERGQLNGKRETLWLALRETIYEPSSSALHQSSSSWKGRGGVGGSEGSPVVLPNSQPNLPDVWLRRSSTQNSGYSS